MRALLRFTECTIAVYRKAPNMEKLNILTKSAIKLLKLQLDRYPVFQPRYYCTMSLYNYIRGNRTKAKHYMTKSMDESQKISCVYDYQKAKDFMTKYL
jgi:hypothetical protein